MELCKDCAHVNKESLKKKTESEVICDRPNNYATSYISPVTGKKIRNTPVLHCDYERALGGCQNGYFFKAHEAKK
jgi:hypothetical protein